MDRQAEILKNITKEKRGIEVGPWHSPLAPRQEGYNCLVLDVFDTETLKVNAKRDPFIANEKITSIESVDLIGTSTLIEQLVGQRGQLGTFDYIISSHNFEHLPNPIKFLQGCGRVLKSGGFLSMAIPDKRGCFDYFRPHTTLGQWIEAFFAERERPSLAQVFDQNSLHSRFKVGEEMKPGFSLDDDPENVCALSTLREAYGAWSNLEAAKAATYPDTHCWMFTPSSLRLLLADAAFLGLSPFSIEEVTPNGNEFYVHLCNLGYKCYTEEQTEHHYFDRQQLLHAIGNECSYNSAASYQARKSAPELDGLVQQVQQLEALATRLQACLDDIYRSTSWRITAPFRKCKKVIGKLWI
jgi:SAM-dependent methyltransferase